MFIVLVWACFVRVPSYWLKLLRCLFLSIGWYVRLIREGKLLLLDKFLYLIVLLSCVFHCNILLNILAFWHVCEYLWVQFHLSNIVTDQYVKFQDCMPLVKSIATITSFSFSLFCLYTIMYACFTLHLSFYIFLPYKSVILYICYVYYCRFLFSHLFLQKSIPSSIWSIWSSEKL